jgi:hypothetical protein
LEVAMISYYGLIKDEDLTGSPADERHRWIHEFQIKFPISSDYQFKQSTRHYGGCPLYGFDKLTHSGPWKCVLGFLIRDGLWRGEASGTESWFITWLDMLYVFIATPLVMWTWLIRVKLIVHFHHSSFAMSIKCIHLMHRHWIVLLVQNTGTLDFQ